MWVLVGYLDGIPQYRAVDGGPVLPRALARKRAGLDGYHAVFRNPTPPRNAPTREIRHGGASVDWIGIVWVCMIAGCSIGC